ncbi:MAG: S-formylglutathione hydrolase [Planctomycetes bacterium ADurb.Bin412]|nr:MAG: S-formylglutathione hydrolase [Planctomycetes bacterium ADurb.Bin412]
MKRTALNVFVIITMMSAAAHAAEIQEVKIPSAAMQCEIPATVILPDSYAGGERAYSVVYLLNGYSSTHHTVVEFAADILTAAVDTYQIILFLPDGGYNSWYFDSPMQPARKYETHLAEAIAFADSHYRTIAAAAGRAITGGSMGGHGSLFFGLRHKELFCAIGVLSGAVDFRPWPQEWDLPQILGPKEEFPQRWDEHVAVGQLDRLKPGELAVYIDVGTQDAFLEVNRTLHGKLLEMGIGHIYVERPGQHDNPYWREAIKYQLFFFGETLSTPKMPETNGKG